MSNLRNYWKKSNIVKNRPFFDVFFRKRAAHRAPQGQCVLARNAGFSMFFSKEAPQPFVESLDRFVVAVYYSFISPWLCSCIR